MDKFEEKLYSCGSECLRRLDATTNSSQTAPSPPQDTDWILKAIDMAMHEALEYKVKTQIEFLCISFSSFFTWVENCEKCGIRSLIEGSYLEKHVYSN